jgi:hypothetical protein
MSFLGLPEPVEDCLVDEDGLHKERGSSAGVGMKELLAQIAELAQKGLEHREALSRLNLGIIRLHESVEAWLPRRLIRSWEMLIQTVWWQRLRTSSGGFLYWRGAGSGRRIVG